MLRLGLGLCLCLRFDHDLDLDLDLVALLISQLMDSQDLHKFVGCTFFVG